MEMLVVLVMMAMATAVIMPSTSRMLDQATAHAVFFEFQRQVSDLRREANRTGLPIRVLDPAVPLGAEGRNRILTLRAPWRYTMAPALDIAEGGVCAPASANLLNQDRVVMTLRTDSGDCRFIRLQTTAAPPPGSSSR